MIGSLLPSRTTIIMAVIAALVVGGLSTVLVVRTAQLAAARLSVELEKGRADRAEEDLKEANKRADDIQKAVQALREMQAKDDALAARVRGVIDRSRNTEADRPLSPLMQDYLQSLREAK